jgi:tetratricopeptide (TPR) repeat protein
MEHDEIRSKVVPHLLAACPVCRKRHDEVRRLQDEIGHWNEEVAVLEGPQAVELWERLAGCTQDERLRLADEDEELHTWGLCQYLIGRSREAVLDSPERAVDLAGLAVRLSVHLSEAYDRDWIYDLRARAFAHLGNARRVLGETRSAEDAFRKAWRCLERSSSGNSAIRAELLSLLASLRRAQRRFGDALRLLDEALPIQRAANASRSVGATLLVKAQILSEAGNVGGAIELLAQGATEINAAAEPHLFAYLRNSLLLCLIDEGRLEEAEPLLTEVQALLTTIGKPLDNVRLRWTEGLLALARGQLGPAEAAFREVQQEFLARGMGYDAALVSLDLAQLYAQEDRRDDLKRLAAELMPVFASRDVHREALVALVLFQKACEEEQMTVTLTREIAAHLRRERVSPACAGGRNGAPG